jgi:WD40-like Beta Propeller Repeat
MEFASLLHHRFEVLNGFAMLKNTAQKLLGLCSLLLVSYATLIAQPVHQIPQGYHEEIFSRFPVVRDIAISPDGTECFFTAQSLLGELSVIVFMKCSDGKCSISGLAPFSGKFQDLEPSFSPDGLRLYFASNRPAHPDSVHPKDYDIWYVQRSNANTAWGAPVRINAPVNSEADEFYPVITKSKNLYFTSNRTGSKGKDDIFVARWESDRYTEPVSVGGEVNSSGYEFNSWVAPDESYMVYTCYNREGGYGSGDLYVSRRVDGNWTSPENLGEYINSKQMDYCPLVHNGNLYFTSRRSGVRSTFLTQPTVLQVINEMQRYDNGAERIYFLRDAGIK